MKKSTIYKIITFVLIIGIAFATVLDVFTFKNLYNAGSFRVELLIAFIGAAALTLALFIGSIYFVIKLIGGKE